MNLSSQILNISSQDKMARKNKNRIVFFSAVLAAGLGFFVLADSASANTGTFLSEIKSSGQNNASWGNITWATTPKRKENIIQIIISNFQDIFGWAKF